MRAQSADSHSIRHVLRHGAILMSNRLPPAAGMLSPDVMNDQRAHQAIERIERALARIEAAASKTPPVTDEAELRELREVHQALRGNVEGAISQLDRLLATADAG